MSLFVCDECGCVDNTALTRFWFRGWSAEELGAGTPLNGRALCSACDPDIACWHSCFPREQYDGKQKVNNR